MLKILHFNDAYKLEPFKSEPVGGFARFHYAWMAEEKASLRLFSGDVFNPSLESTVTKGKHLVEPLNALKLDASCSFIF
jgi:5'-nucleotidase